MSNIVAVRETVITWGTEEGKSQAEMVSNYERISLDPRLHYAAKKGDIHLLDEILRPKLVKNYPQRGEIVIPVAVEAEAPLQHSKSQASYLLGATHGGNTALHIATHFGHLEVATRICHVNVSLLMKKNAKSETALHYAAKAGRHELVALFIKLASAEASNIDLGEILRKRNRDGETALYQAVLCNHLSVVEEFHNAGDNQFFSQLASIPNNENISPLYLAIMNDQLAIVTSLIGSLPVNVLRGAYAGPDGQTALHAAALRHGGFAQKVIEWKLELAKSTDNSGSTPLHYAASSDNLEAVRAILQKDITCAYMADSSGIYPVHLAVKMGFAEIVAELFDLCPDMDELLDKEGRNFVHIAVEEQNEGIVRWICRKTELVEAMNAHNNNGDTAMHLAVKAKHINIFANLLGTKKAHLCVTNKDGLTPHDLAISERTVGLAHWQNPNLMMIRTLGLIRCCRGIKRRDHFVSKYLLQFDQKKEKIVENFESMAKNMAIGTVLIASAAFAAAFTVSKAYKADIHAGHKSPGLSLAFSSFILMVVYAFVCSITATCLLIEAALTILDPLCRWNYLMMASILIKMATKGFVVSFALGVYVVLAPVSKWLASLVCFTGVVVPVLLQPHLCPNFLVTRALIRYLGWRGFFWGFLNAFWGNILFGIFVLFVLIGSLVTSRGAFPAVLVLAYGTAIILVSVFRFFPIGRRLLGSTKKGFEI